MREHLTNLTDCDLVPVWRPALVIRKECFVTHFSVLERRSYDGEGGGLGGWEGLEIFKCLNCRTCLLSIFHSKMQPC